MRNLANAKGKAKENLTKLLTPSLLVFDHFEGWDA